MMKPITYRIAVRGICLSATEALENRYFACALKLELVCFEALQVCFWRLRRWINLQRLAVIRYCTSAIALVLVGKTTVVVGLRIPRIDLYRLGVIDGGAVELTLAIVRDAAVVVGLRVP